MDEENGAYIHNRVSFSHKEDQILSFSVKELEVVLIMLIEINQTQKEKCHMFVVICGV
jgi:hypothetical protein